MQLLFQVGVTPFAIIAFLVPTDFVPAISVRLAPHVFSESTPFLACNLLQVFKFSLPTSNRRKVQVNRSQYKSIVIKSHCHHMHNLKGTARGAGLTARVLVRTIMDGSTAVMYLGVISATRRHWGCPRKSVQFHFLVISRYIIITL